MKRTRNFSISLLLLWCYSFSYGQMNFNLELLANVNEFPSIGYNDIWGFVDQNGVEYAVLGVRNATAIYSLADPTEPNQVALIPGATAIWRDMKSYKDHIYVTTDQGMDGLLSIDMSQAPDNITWEFWQPAIEDNGAMVSLNTCHNLFIDENGYCYLSGCNVNRGGILVVDVNDPENLQVVGKGDARYSHDNFARGDTVWSADIISGFFSVMDATNKDSLITISDQTTTSNFTHNCWLSDDGKYLFTTDERPDATVDAYDVSDLDNIQFLDAFLPLDTEGLRAAPHNTHYHNGFLVTSWYTDGVVITDAHRPANMIEVGHYDTFLGIDGGFSGCWGAYPFLPSGLVLASDISTGLYVFQPNYQRACYLEGVVTDSVTGMGVDGVKVEIASNQTNRANTDFTGAYKTGQAASGTFEVRFLKEGYQTKVVSIELENGELTVLDVELVPLELVTFTGRTINAEDGSRIPLASIILINETSNIVQNSDENGDFQFTVFLGEYEVRGAAWGYRHEVISNFQMDNTGTPKDILLTPGYQDDFFTDLGWKSETDSATAGLWVRDVPIRTVFGSGLSNPDMDVDSDIGEECFMTGNRGRDAGFDDVDNGNVILTSPPMRLEEYEDPILLFNYWFFNNGGTPPQDDRFSIFVSNGMDTVMVDTISNSEDSWRNSSEYRIKDFIALTNEVRVIYQTGDQRGSGHLVEAAIDAFLVVEAEELIPDSTTTSTDFSKSPIRTVFPNPFNQSTILQVEPGAKVVVQAFNSVGQIIETVRNNGTQIELGANWDKGIYFLRVKSLTDGRLHSLKIIKQ